MPVGGEPFAGEQGEKLGALSALADFHFQSSSSPSPPPPAQDRVGKIHVNREVEPDGYGNTQAISPAFTMMAHNKRKNSAINFLIMTF